MTRDKKKKEKKKRKMKNHKCQCNKLLSGSKEEMLMLMIVECEEKGSGFKSPGGSFTHIYT